MAGRTLIIPIYYLILITCIGVSSNFSFRGFQETFPNEIYFVVLILALGLFGAGLMLQQGRDKQSISQQLLALLIFFIFASFSTSSNMNYIYTKMKWEDVRKEAFRQEYQKYKDTIDGIDKHLKASVVLDTDYFERIATGYFNLITKEIDNFKLKIVNSEYYLSQKEISNKLDYQLDQMYVQATDPNAPGCGPKCRAHMEVIDALVPTTETKTVKGKSLKEIKTNWGNYRDQKKRAFCDDAFAGYHTLRGFVENIPNTDFCKSDSRVYAQKYGSNEVEKLRSLIARAQKYDETSLLEYLSNVSRVATLIEQKSKQISSLGDSLAGSDYKKVDNYPRSIAEAVELISLNDETFDVLDIAGIQLRKKLQTDILDKKFLTGIVSSESFEDDKTILFDLELTQNDIVQSIDEPLRPFLEVVASKQNLLLSRYADAIADAKPDEFFKIDPNNGQIGEVQYTLNLAFSNITQTTIISLLLGAAFDLIPVIFAFAAFHGYRPPEEQYKPWTG